VSPLPLALAASIDHRTRRVKNLSGLLLWGTFPFAVASGPIPTKWEHGFVALPDPIPMTITGFSDASFFESYGLPTSFPIKANSYGTPSSGINLPGSCSPGSCDTYVANGFTKIDLPSSLSATLALTFNGVPGFPLPPQSGDYTAQIGLDLSGSQVGCLEVSFSTTDTGPVACFAPDITDLNASPDVLWPPDGQLVPVTLIGKTWLGSCGASNCQITSVTSNQPPGSDAVADGEAVITGPLTLELKADRTGSGGGNGGGRVYTITLECTDTYGNTTTGTTRVLVPLHPGD
jgi:hypothetical protein